MVSVAPPNTGWGEPCVDGERRHSYLTRVHVASQAPHGFVCGRSRRLGDGCSQFTVSYPEQRDGVHGTVRTLLLCCGASLLHVSIKADFQPIRKEPYVFSRLADLLPPAWVMSSPSCGGQQDCAGCPRADTGILQGGDPEDLGRSTG